MHGALCDVTTGEVLDSPADENLKVYQVQIDGEDILVEPAAG
jgi:nitrite reductase/ring-hydroxylating ferredoxin subunit